MVDFDRISRDDKKMHEAILGCVRHLHVAVEKRFQVDGRGLRKGSFSISVESMGRRSHFDDAREPSTASFRFELLLVEVCSST